MKKLETLPDGRIKYKKIEHLWLYDQLNDGLYKKPLCRINILDKIMAWIKDNHSYMVCIKTCRSIPNCPKCLKMQSKNWLTLN